MMNVLNIGGQTAMAMELTSPAFSNGSSISQKYTGEGQDVSPQLSWSDAPAAAQEFVLICDDPDAPMGTWVHWVIYAIPAGRNSLPEAVPLVPAWEAGIKQGKNDFGRFGYGGPLPPPGKPHRYFFTLYALDKVMGFAPGMTRKAVLKAIEGHVLDKAQLMGTYKR
jgi:Raf kinase inhibitor-like YbhB/YbcL family protein